MYVCVKNISVDNCYPILLLCSEGLFLGTICRNILSSPLSPCDWKDETHTCLCVLYVDDGGDRLVAAGVFSQCGTLLAAHRCCEGKVAQLIAELAKDGNVVAFRDGLVVTRAFKLTVHVWYRGHQSSWW